MKAWININVADMNSITRFVMVSMLAAALPALADEPPEPKKRYTIRDADAQTGSHIKRDAVTSTLPMDKAYGELSAEQKAWIKSNYEDMAEEDEPPFPLEGLGAIYKPLGQAGQQLKDKGMLSLHVWVDSQGKATSVEVLKSPSRAMTKFAASLAGLTKFKPAVCGGQPCKMVFPIDLEFVIRR
jgi:outer membrane biosynthesis protein TonB